MTKNKIFLDVGAHVGETLAVVLEAKYGFDRLYCFEPVSECCDVLRTYKDERVMVCEYGLWNENVTKAIYNPKTMGASLFKDKFRTEVSSRDIKLVKASEWFAQHLKTEDSVYLKLNCEGAECAILDDLIDSGEYKKIDVLMVDFDVCKIPSQRHLMSGMRAKLNTLNIPQIFYADKYHFGKGAHSRFTHFWLDDSLQINQKNRVSSPKDTISYGMKNILIYTGPHKALSEEHSRLARIQIDNSFDLGWKKEDILFVTDFPYEYNGVKSLVVPDGLYYEFDNNANKSVVLVHLLRQGIIEPGTLYWCHDFDAYENYRIDESELGLGQYDLGLTHYFYKPEWQFGSLFFKSSAQDIFELLDEAIRKRPRSSRNNEKKLTTLIKDGKIDSSQYKRMNSTYNFMKKYMHIVYPEAEKPLKVLHFLPSQKTEDMPHSALEMFMYGKNALKISLMSDKLIKIFQHHGIS